MKFEVVNGQFGFIGKVSERSQMEKALEILNEELDGLGCIDDEEWNGKLEINYGYDTDAYKVIDVKEIWKDIKKTI